MGIIGLMVDVADACTALRAAWVHVVVAGDLATALEVTAIGLTGAAAVVVGSLAAVVVATVGLAVAAAAAVGRTTPAVLDRTTWGTGDVDVGVGCWA